MKILYFEDTDTLSIEFNAGPSVDTDEIAQGVTVDYDNNGQVISIDFDLASKKMNLEAIEVLGLAIPVETSKLLAK